MSAVRIASSIARRSSGARKSMSRAISSGVGSRPSSCARPPLHAHLAVDALDHVHRNADGARLVGDGPADGLADPPGGIGAELEPQVVVELLHRPQQANVAFLDQVAKLIPRPMYRLATLTTRRRLALVNRCWARCGHGARCRATRRGYRRPGRARWPIAASAALPLWI